MEIRKATINDLPSIQDIARRTVDACYRSFLGDEGVEWYISTGECDREVERHMDHCILSTDGDTITGFCMFFDNVLHWILVDINHQKRGIGSKLLSCTEEQLFKKGHNTIQLETIEGNENAMGFYLAHGWSVVDKQKDKTYDFMRYLLEKKNLKQ